MKLWVPSYEDRGKEGFIAEIGKLDAYHKYGLVGTRIKFIQTINRRWDVDMSISRIEQEFFSAYLMMLEGIFAGETLHFFKVKVAYQFPFELLMRKALG